MGNSLFKLIFCCLLKCCISYCYLVSTQNNNSMCDPSTEFRILLWPRWSPHQSEMPLHKGAGWGYYSCKGITLCKIYYISFIWSM